MLVMSCCVKTQTLRPLCLALNANQFIRPLSHIFRRSAIVENDQGIGSLYHKTHYPQAIIKLIQFIPVETFVSRVELISWAEQKSRNQTRDIESFQDS